MQVQSEKKRDKILDSAAKLFATRPFHKVLLSDIAAAASVGKGTLYVYFKSKDDVYLSVLYSGFSRLVDEIRQRIGEKSSDPKKDLETIIAQFVEFAFQNPHLFELLRTIDRQRASCRAKWMRRRREIMDLIKSIVIQGVEQGVFADAHPEWTARLIAGLMRSILIDGAENMDQRELVRHLQGFAMAALLNKGVLT